MDMSVSATVDTAMALQQHNTASEVQANLLRKSLDTQEQQMSQLMESVAPQPQLATEGLVGTQINTTA
ncbi:putative motility protein [Kushneria aurantia]|uniref:Motility protein n=1 Tax=Kushneria aurantia TaxID=504092 RepID=A0ABV6G256_9GAMM|nr:putative motility protein [Kushneria aurantia]